MKNKKQMGQIVNQEEGSRFKLKNAAVVSLMFTGQKTPAQGRNVVIMEQVSRVGQRECFVP